VQVESFIKKSKYLQKDVCHNQQYAKTKEAIRQEDNERFCTDGYKTAKCSRINQVTVCLNSHIKGCGSQNYEEKPTLSMVYNVIKGLKKNRASLRME
jgi:hypothetical protein